MAISFPQYLSARDDEWGKDPNISANQRRDERGADQSEARAWRQLQMESLSSNEWPCPSLIMEILSENRYEMYPRR